MTTTTYQLTDTEHEVLLAALSDHRDSLEDRLFQEAGTAAASVSRLRADLDRAIELYERIIYATTIHITSEEGK